MKKSALFREFFKVAPSVYSDIQHYWDIYKEKSKINIIVCGSVYSLMHKIFENQKESLFGRQIGGYLTKLEQDYGLIAKSTPIFAKVETKNVRYVIEDNFLMFWFRFIYKYGYMVEVGNYEGLKTIIDRDYKTFSGKMLEKYFRTKFIQSGKITHIGGYWDRKGENEIDLVVVNEIDW